MCRCPVKTIATPYSSALAMASASRIEPPGWITAVTPALAHTSSESGNGMNASLAQTAHFAFSPAFSTAILALSTRLIWPAPTPTLTKSFASRIALLFTLLATFQAKRSCSSSSSVGLRFVGTVNSAGFSEAESDVCTSMPPSTERDS